MLATASTAAKDEALRAAADLLEQRAGDVLAANVADLEAAAAGGMDAGPLDRLKLTDARLAGMAEGLRKVASLPDPVGEILDGWKRPNGLEISRVRVPLGVVAIIYENRPNVTSDAGGLCLKSGNAALLRGSSTALRSNQAVTALLREGAAKAGLPEDSVLLVEDVSHEAAVELMQLTGYVDCLIPRGGPSLVRSILDNAKVPYVIDGDGNCHVYVDAAANLDRALDIVLNAKTQRPSVCNAAESLLVHRAVADGFLPRVAGALQKAGVELVGDEASRRLVPGMGEATDDDFGREFLTLKMSVAVVGRPRGGRHPHQPVRHRPYRGHRHRGHRRRPPLRRGGRRRHRHGQRLHPLHRRRGVRLRRRDRHLDPEAPRPGSDGAAGAHHLQVRRVG